MGHILEEATEIWLHPNKVNTDGGFTLSQAWHPVTIMLKQFSETPRKKARPDMASTSLCLAMSASSVQVYEGTIKSIQSHQIPYDRNRDGS
jgi:hypothetical protein